MALTSIASLFTRDTRLLEVEAVDVGRASGRDQQMAAVDLVGAGLGLDQHPDAGLAAPFDRRSLRAFADDDAFGAQLADDDRGHLGIFAGEHGPGFEQRDLGTEAPERLRQFQSRRAAAEDDEMPRPRPSWNTVSLVRQPISAMPGMAGTIGDEPVAST